MLRQTSVICGLLAVTGLVASCTQSALDLPPGTYHKDVSSTDENGVTTEYKTSTNVEVDSSGHKTATVTSRTTEKPPGLFGAFRKKTTNESTEVLEGDSSR